MAIELNVEVREDLGKGASRRLRHANMVPAIIYGAEKEASNIMLPHNVVTKQLENELFYTQVMTLKVGKTAEKVVLRDIQHHPIKQQVLHMDFLRINPKQKMHVHIPLHFINEETAPGVKAGGKINHVQIEMEVICLPKDIPEFIEVDMGALEMDQSVHLSDIKLPKGVECVALSHGEDHDSAIAAIHAVRGASEEVETGAPVAPSNEPEAE
ncbi:MAG: 50S ribosomal protein L25/general stress protein Ctc [Gammaproteobacteria bacterium]|nr:50S ribosomal protein L25/general stress protein Ctc [Gammaproteobacteria bacterium]